MIRKATMDDLTTIMEIVPRIIGEMHSYNNFQWDEQYPQAQDFAEDIRRGDLYVAMGERNMAGFICINRIQPQEYAALPWSLTDDCLVIHRMAVSPDCRKMGVGAQLVSFADEVALQHKVACLKTDTYSLNQNAQGLFQKLGYSFVGEMSFLGKEKPFYCYEKTIASR